MSNSKFLPVCEPTIGEREKEYLLDAVETGWISSSGAYIQRFEEGFSRKVGARFGVSACNGTSALHLGLKSFNLSFGDEVILPSFTMVASANAIEYCGLKPIFVDSDPNNWTMDPEAIEAAITEKTKAIMSVTIYGHPCDFEMIEELCKKHGLYWIEDAAEGHGSLYRDKPLAQFPDVTVYSFFANKIVTSGEGGMICTNDERLSDRCRYLKNLAFPLKGPRNYIHEEVGFNYRMTNMQAAIGCAQTERLEELTGLRRKNAMFYNEALSSLKNFLQLPMEEPWARNCYWMYALVLKPQAKIKRDQLMAELKELGIDSRPFFYPMHWQPIYKTEQSLPVSEELSSSGFYLPSSSHLTELDIERVVNGLTRILC